MSKSGKERAGRGLFYLCSRRCFVKKCSLLLEAVDLSDAKKSFKGGIEEGTLLSCMHLINIASDYEIKITCRVSTGAFDIACCVSK